MELTANTMVGDDVKLERPLEAGGMGSVWVGRHLPTNHEVAVKFIHEELLEQEPTVLDRFEREASVLDKVRNPHIVKLFSRGTLDDGTPYIVMELVKGENFADWLVRTEQWLSLEQVGVLLEQMAIALEPVHALKIVHRDIKGENVLLVGDADELFIKVIDFGCAKTPWLPGHPKLTAPGMLLGSPEYMSPEQIISAANVDHRTDLWAMSVVAYTAVTLTLPFRGETLGDVFAAIRFGKFTPASEERDSLPPAVDAWFAQALAVNRDNRFASAREMSDAWQRAIAPEVISAPTDASPAPPGIPRSLAIALGIGLLIVLVVVAVVLM